MNRDPKCVLTSGPWRLVARKGVNKMQRRFYAVAACAILAACGTSAKNADVSTGFSIAGQQPVADDSGVTIATSGPEVGAGGQRVFGTSCKNKMWDPPPSDTNATALMKRQAKELGFNSVHSVEVKADNAAISKNCWSAIVASGIAFSVP